MEQQLIQLNKEVIKMSEVILQNEIYGYEVCPPWLKICYRRSVNFTCQECHLHETIVGILIPHRLLRSNQGGLYTVVPLSHPCNNVKIVCLACHKLLHANEFRNVRSL